jgi:chaperonin cofactor prefoldin
MANYQYEKSVLETFIKNQGQLFDENVAESLEEADEFLDMMMATVVDNEKQLKSYFDELGVDTEDDILNAAEVFKLDDGRFLIVEG